MPTSRNDVPLQNGTRIIDKKSGREGVIRSNWREHGYLRYTVLWDDGLQTLGAPRSTFRLAR